MTSPRDGQMRDSGWRKAVVACIAMICLTVLGSLGRLDAETVWPILAIAGGYLGVNLWSYRR